ncbi:15353_t:CDS:1 [Funneliformis geosporum]|nr:15353_t:CDS:1 [Funneliformis geosporum]
MSLSKIFCGEYPEMTLFVLKYLRDDLKSLYSCILVNRSLCRMTIPILWENPFELKCLDGKRDFIKNYFIFFSRLERKKLIEFGAKIEPISTPLFNYPSFIKTLDTFRMELHVINWVNNLNTILSTPRGKDTYRYTITFLDYEKEVFLIKNHNSRLKKIVDTLCGFLLKSFIINNASLKNFNLKISNSHGHYLPKFFQMIFDNATFVSHVENFRVGFIANPHVLNFSQLESLFTSLPSSLPLVKNFHISYIARSKNLNNMLKSKAVLLSLNVSLDAFNYYNNRLTSIEFHRCNFKNVDTFDELNDFTQLRYLSFINCKSIKPQFFQPLLDTQTPLKLKSLKLTGPPTGFDLLIQKAGYYLENLELFLFGASGQVYESIRIHCDQIKFFHLANLHHDDNSQLYGMITRNNESLKYLTIASCMSGKMNSKFLCGLASLLPKSLEYLDLEIVIDIKGLKTFLSNLRHVELNTLLFRHKIKNESFDVFDIVTDFVIQNKIRNFSYRLNKCFNPYDHDIFALFNMVNFERPSVKLERYSDLVVSLSDFY